MFTPVKVVRASEDVVEQIKEAIFSGKLLPGDRLPPERELVRTFGLSRVTIREAIHRLETAGFVRIKTGASGGAFVAEASAKIVSDSLTTLLKLKKTTVWELQEARKVVETAIVEMAAARADESDLAAMAEANEHTRQAIASNTHYAPSILEFHTALAIAAKNSVLLSTVNSFRDQLFQALDKLGFLPELPSMALDYHEKIYDAVRRREPTDARRLMQVHLQHFDDRLRLLDTSEASVVEDNSADLPISHSAE